MADEVDEAQEELEAPNFEGTPEERADLDLSSPLTTRKELLVGVGLFFGAILLIGGVILLRGDAGDDIPGSVAATGSTTPTASSLPSGQPPGSTQLFVVPANPDEQAIENLGRLSIILLPEGHWPQLYDDFTDDFRARCSEADFAAAGVQGAEAFGDQLQALQFLGLETLTITGEEATAVVVYQAGAGTVPGKLEASFRKVNESWKLAPAADTTGCSAFHDLNAAAAES